MQFKQSNSHNGPAIATFLALLLGSMSLQADRILVIGDSWATPIGNELRGVLIRNGHAEVIVQTTPFWGRAIKLISQEGLDWISTTLDSSPDTTIVHMSIGGNDWGTNWTSDLAGTKKEDEVLAKIVADVETLVDYILSLRPDIHVVWSSYDFVRPQKLGTPAELGAVEIKMSVLAEQLAMTKPGFSFVNVIGTLQVKFGFNGVQYTEFDPPFVIPPGDPSLPDPTLPSPKAAFPVRSLNHPTMQGYRFLAQAQYDRFYGPFLSDPGFQINADHAGAWFNPDTSGQGQFIDVEPGEQFMFVSWFTYTDAASANPNEQRWLTAQGNYSGNTAQLDLFETLGGRFDDPQAVTSTQIGEVSLSFSDCGQGKLTYSIDGEGLQGEFPLLRVIPGSGNMCEERSGNTTQAVDINAGMDGAWFDSNTPGQGFFIDTHPDPEGGNFIFVAWFTYGDDTASGQRWLTAQGGFEGSNAEIDVFESNGGDFDDPQPPSTTKVGTMSINFTDCNNAQLSYSLPANSAEGDIAITRVVPGGQALCEELSGAD